MNVLNLTLKSLAFWLFILLPSLVWSQGYTQHQITQDEVFEEFFFSSISPGSSSYPTQASNGTVVIEDHATVNGQIEYVLRYTPNPGFLGKDSLSYIYFVGFARHYVFLEIEVVESQVVAENDYVAVLENTPITFDVLANDFSSTDSLNITTVPVVNGGTLTVDAAQQITFTPDQDFNGVAQFHYTVCNEDERCDIALVYVFVEKGFTTLDTIDIFAKKNTPVNVLLPAAQGGYQIPVNPANGTLSPSDPAGILVYEPNANFVGNDAFTAFYLFNSQPSVQVYRVKVLNAPSENTIVFDDIARTGVNNAVSIDVLANDLVDDLYVLNNTSVTHGSLAVSGSVFTYTPAQNFVGADVFTYRACVLNSGLCEDGEVRIVVSDQRPAQTVYDLSTPMNTPIVVDYNIPIDSWNFSVHGTGPGDTEAETIGGGLIQYFPGQYTGGPIAGQDISGYNILVYTPPADEVLEDVAEFDFCTASGCQLVKLNIDVTDPPGVDDPYCVTDCVWPGDVNSDGVVNMIDLLPLGYCIGETGPERMNGSMDWYGQYGDDWGRSIMNTTTDFKHIDSDGDGVVSDIDTAAIVANFGKFSKITASPEPAASRRQLYLIPRTTSYNPGDLVIIDIFFGTQQNPILDANGVVFGYGYDTTFVDASSVRVDFNPDSWFRYDAPTIDLKNKTYNRIDAGITRTNGRAGHGFGNLGTLSFIIRDEIDGLRPGEEYQFPNTTDNPVAMTNTGQLVGLEVIAEPFVINFTKNDDPIDELDLNVFPNPTQSYINLHLNGEKEISEVSLYTLTGQLVYENTNVNNNQHRINVLGKQYSNGMYIVRVKTGEEVISKKVQIVR